jgi:O-antigen/teichoic acid export membrane protein
MLKKTTTDIFSLFSSSMLGQLVHIIALPYLSAYFSQTEIGAFFFFQALVTLGIIFVSFQSEQAIVVESSENSYLVFKKSIIIISIMSMLVFILLSIFPVVFDLIPKKTSVSTWFYFIPIGLFIVGTNNTFEFLFTHEKKFRIISIVRIGRPLLIYSVIVILQLTKIDIRNPLIVGFLVGSGLIFLYQAILIASNKLCRFNKSDFSIAGFKYFYKKHNNILIFNTLSSSIASASMQIPYIFISFVFGESYSAYYGMAMRIIGMPLSLLGQSFGQVYFQKFSYISYYKHSIYPILKRLMFQTYLLGIVPLIVLIIFTPQLFALFLGKGWETASFLSRILLPWLFVLMVSSPLSYAVSVLGIQRKTVYYNILLFLFRITSLYISWQFGFSFILTMAIFSGIGIAFNISYQFIILYFSRKHKIA